MICRSLFRLSVFVAGFGLIVSALVVNAQDTSQRGRKYKSPPPTARVEVTVLRDVNAKPIENAAVIFHLVGEKGNMELKTNEGGKVRLQVIAKGFQTYGEDFNIDKAELGIGVKMKRPGEQYSIYPKSSTAPPPEAQPSQPQPK
jgi:hypothetical protein